METSKWTIESVKIGERVLYQAISFMAGTKIMRGGLWETKAEAEKIAETLNQEMEK